MKKIISLCLVALISASSIYAAAEPLVNEKVLKAFQESFPEVTGPTWRSIDYENQQFDEVYFKSADNSSHRITYDKEGMVLQTISYYGEQSLSTAIRAKVNTKYPGKSIFGVTEVYNTEGLTYYIILKDDNYWYHVESDGSGIIKLDRKLTVTG